MTLSLAAEWGTGQVFWSMLWFFLFVILAWLVIAVLVDALRSPDLSGLAKALWVLFVVFAPLLGVLVYVIARGNRMQPLALRFWLPAPGPPRREVLTRDQVDALARLAEQRDQQLISAAEYRAQREEILG
ncbi:MAG: SHOCT domain-containing protein [Acidimicrobiia bacterium]